MRIEPGRDYYEDLGVTFPADDAEIKQRYRKAALKHHPDRNPGNEEQAQSAFVLIQTAFDVLSDPITKAKYDATYLQKFVHRPSPAAASEPGMASGVRGNPWQDAGKGFPPPPQRADRRARQPPPTPTGGQRWQQWQEFRRPPTAKEADPENVFEAFTQMRPKNHQHSNPPKVPPREPPNVPPREAPNPPPRDDDADDRRGDRRKDREGRGAEGPPLPPRSATMRQRAEAAFGNSSSNSKKSGYYPHSPMPEDEPQVGSTKNYETSRHTSDLFAESARRARNAAASAGVGVGAAAATTAAAAAFVAGAAAASASASAAFAAGAGSATEDSHDERRGSFLRERRPSEYRSHGGEKYDPFDGSARPKSSRSRRRRAPDPNESSDTQSATGAPRSSSLPTDDVSPANASPRWEGDPDIERPRTGGRLHTTDFVSEPFFARAGSRHPPRPAPFDSGDDMSPHSTPHQPSDRFWAGFRQDIPKTSLPPPPQPPPPPPPPPRPPPPPPSHPPPATYDDRQDTGTFFPDTGEAPQETPIFRYSVDDPRPSPSVSDRNQFSPEAPPDVRFAAPSESGNYQFSAGSGAPSGPERIRIKKAGRRSPLKNPIYPAPEADDAASGAKSETDARSETDADTEASDRGGFDPDEWKRHFGMHTFVPSPAAGGTDAGMRTTSPTRGGHGLRRTKSFKPTMGNAGLADESTSDDGDEQPARPGARDSRSPNAMDIDVEPPAGGGGTASGAAAGAASPSPGPHVNGARNISVEPNRPEWRDRDAGGGGGGGGNDDAAPTPTSAPPAASSTAPIPSPAADAGLRGEPSIPALANACGSEDSEEFRASFADFRNVAPFAKAAGLGSLGDLKSTLPFDTKPSARVPIARKPLNQELQFPHVPSPPPALPVAGVSGTKPPASVWAPYARAFEDYMRRWDEFDHLIVEHFRARATGRRDEGYGFLNTRGDDGLRVYHNAVKQDLAVRQKWTDACVDHELWVREFMALREKML